MNRCNHFYLGYCSSMSNVSETTRVAATCAFHTPDTRCKPCKQSGFQRGFTLLELMIVIVIMTILATIALPSFIETIRDNRVTNAAQQLQAALLTARSASIARGARVSVAPLKNGPFHEDNWSNGWVVFIDANSNGQFDAGEVIISKQEPWASASNKTDYYFSTSVPPIAGYVQGVPSYVAGRPQQINGALGFYSFVVGLNAQATGGSGQSIPSAKHWRTLCVAVTGRMRMVKAGDPGVSTTGVSVNGDCPGND